MISCKQLEDFCVDFLEGDLPDQEEQDFRRHLALCCHCVSFFETYQRTPQISREVLRTQMPRDVKDSVLAYLRERISSD